MSWLSCIYVLSWLLALTQGQSQNETQDSWPHAYPGMPAGDLSPEWQDYFLVTETLPNVSWPLGRNWAGNIPVQRKGHPNNTLFFWAFESSQGSLTEDSDKPWGIWLNGGPGASTMAGLLFENGPLHISSDYSIGPNPHAWSKVADYVWVDQPVGTGFSTVDRNGLAADENQLAADFMGFLDNFTKVFPHLAKRPLIITGESYAGTYIPYITKAYFEMEIAPVNLTRIAIGNGVIGSLEAYREVTVMTVLETYPQLIGYDTRVFEYFKEQSALCGYNLTLQYPQPEHFPTLNAPLPWNSSGSSSKSVVQLTKRDFMVEMQDRFAAKLRVSDSALPERSERREVWKRDLSGRANGTIDPWYQCDVYDEMVDYAVNFTFPWTLGGFDPYNVPDALNPEVPMDASVFLNDHRTRTAIHAPTSKNWTMFTDEVFAPTNSSKNDAGASVEPMGFLTDLATNMTARNMKMIIYSGNDDSLVPHFGSQVAIQNTTFGGIQGFTRKPETPWHNDAGEFGGIVHQERGWTYVLLYHTGHLLGYSNPVSALTLVREFIFGDNPTGLVYNTSAGTTVVGGEDPSLGNEVLRGQAEIYYGSATTASTYFFPSKTVAAWDSYIATATATSERGTPEGTKRCTGDAGQSSSQSCFT